MGKTPSYVKDAVNNYRKKYDFIQVRFPKGTRERLKDVGNINDFIVKCVTDALENVQNPDSHAEATTSNETPRQHKKSRYANPIRALR